MSDFSDGSYSIICIVLLGYIVLDRLDWIVSYFIVSAGSGNIGFYALAGYCLDGTDGTDVLDGVLMEKGLRRTDVSRRQNGRSTMGARTGSPLLDLEVWKCAGWLLPTWDRWDRWIGWGVGGMGVGRTYVITRLNGSATSLPEQERYCWIFRGGVLCKEVAGTKCVGASRMRSICVRGKKIQIQDSINSTYDKIVLWLHTTINCTYNINLPKKKSQKNPDPNIEDSVRFKAEKVGQLLQLAIFCKYLQAENVGGKYSFKLNI